MAELPEGCPVKEILRQLAMILELYKPILEHCDICVKGGEQNDGQDK